MKPIGLVTCYYHHNYGSMLQAYATEMIMQKMSLPYETIACKSPIDYMTESRFLYISKKILVGDWRMRLGKIKIAKMKRKYPEFAKKYAIRDSYFNLFASESFHVSPYCSDRKSLENMAHNYSAFLVGSDQLWRTDSVDHGYYTLEWVPDDVKKIAYSTSFGITKIPWFQRAKNIRFMNRFDSIAVREKSGAQLIKKLTGKDVPVVLDPTLLFTGEDWMSIQQKEPIVNEKYIFCYLLGDNSSQRELVKIIKEKTNFKIIALIHLDDYIPADEDFADETLYNVGPKEFLNLLRNAEYVFTDSFHCSVFSILYKKNFFTFSRFSDTSRQSTNTRIDNLLELTELTDRRITRDRGVDYIMNLQLNFTNTDQKLMLLRKYSFDYLENAFKDFK